MILVEPLRTALLGNTAITDLLAEWKEHPSIHTRRPIPKEVKAYPLILINPDVFVGDADYLNSKVPVIIKDIVVYGNQPGDYRAVEQIAWLIREQFHRNRQSISVENYQSVMVVATGPMVGPTDDDTRVARIVTLTITLHRR